MSWIKMLPGVVLAVQKAVAREGHVHVFTARIIATRIARGSCITGLEALAILRDLGVWSEIPGGEHGESPAEYGIMLPWPRSDAAIFAHDPTAHELACDAIEWIVTTATRERLWSTWSALRWSNLLTRANLEPRQ